MKISIVNLPVQGTSFHWQESDRWINHLGIGYIGAVLEEKGHTVEIFDCPQERLSLNELIERISNKQWDVVGLTFYHTNIVYVGRFLNSLTKMDKKPYIFTGGHYATTISEKLLQGFPLIDSVVLGEGEIAAVEMLSRLSAGNNEMDGINGILWRKKGELVKERPGRLVNDLDSLPIPKRNLLSGQWRAPIIATRGCYGKCSFCDIRMFYKHSKGSMIRARSPINVVKELIYLESLGITHVQFYDDNFLGVINNIDGWAEDFNKIKIESGCNIKFDIRCRVNDCFNIENLKLFRDCGLTKVYLGIESGVERSLEFFRKDISPSQIIEAVNILRNLNIWIDCGLIFLEPFTTCDEVIENISFMKKIQYKNFVDAVPISLRKPLMLVPGTPVYDMFEINKKLTKEYPGYVFENYEMNKLWSYILKWKETLSKEWNRVQNDDNYGQPSDSRITYFINTDLDFLEDMATTLIKKAGDEEAVFEKWVKAINL